MVCGARLNDEPAFEQCEGVRFASFPLKAGAYLFRVAERLQQKHSPPARLRIID
jgi:hypothetical protein